MIREKINKANTAMAAFVLSILAKFGLRDTVERVAHGDRVYIDTATFGMFTPDLGGLAHDGRGQLGLQTILAALVVVIAVSLAVIVVDRFDSSLGDPSSSSLSTAQNDVLGGFADMTSLIGPLLLVAIAVVIIGLIRRVS